MPCGRRTGEGSTLPNVFAAPTLTNRTSWYSARGFSPLRNQIGTPLLIVMAVVVLVLMACATCTKPAAGEGGGTGARCQCVTPWERARQILRQLLAEGLLLAGRNPGAAAGAHGSISLATRPTCRFQRGHAHPAVQLRAGACSECAVQPGPSLVLIPTWPIHSSSNDLPTAAALSARAQVASACCAVVCAHAAKSADPRCRRLPPITW